jgi:hypothetical protein
MKNDEFSVGATRMGFASKPVWCPSNKLLNVSIFPVNQDFNNTDQNKVSVLVNFDTGAVKVHTHLFSHFACETL